jgi:putative hydrolase of the HAD superfamily
MPAAIEAVLLDVGGVFALPHPDMVRAALGVDFDEEGAARSHYAGGAAIDALGLGEWSAYFTAYALEAGVPPSRLRVVLPALRHAFRAPDDVDVWSLFVPAAVQALERLRQTRVALAVVSNSDGTVERLLRDNGVCQVGEGAGTCVSVVVDSGAVGSEKPDPAIFVHALDVLGVDPDRAVHVGDMVHADVLGARAAGVRPLHLDPYAFCPLDDHEHVSSLNDVVELVYASRVSPTLTSRPAAGPPWKMPLSGETSV